MKHIRGTWYLSACRHTVSDWGWTPATESKTTIPPSSTLKLLSTSAVKSTCPGVSIMFKSQSFHCVAVAAETIVIPLSLSWSIQSVAVFPSSTVPNLWIRPEKYRTLSDTVVLPASICAIKPIFLVCFKEFCATVCILQHALNVNYHR